MYGIALQWDKEGFRDNWNPIHRKVSHKPISQAQARTIIEAAFAKDQELRLKPLRTVFLDVGGRPVAFNRADGA
ncbi:hypothetical protein [Sphingopyxis sp. FD7]|uniref:hypothetical protein n=1 Tax=Sphingopyxis sp. FD7 TaxID=1914525 RepID=UPI000DC61DB0|nr:hypothetical protein [Sphingopyxis sp. FD7]BBB12161.1 GlcG protein [Sphingopyxis sp. FD7]